jgi:hypothetical protein
MADSNNDELICFIGGRFEAMSERLTAIEERMVTREHHDVSITAVRGDIEQVQLRLDSMEHSVASRFELVEGQISRLRSAVYLLGKNDPHVLRLLGHQTS